MKIVSIRIYHGGKFQNSPFKEFCDENDIPHNFSTPRIPQQNGDVERKIMSLEELVSTMISETNLPKYF